MPTTTTPAKKVKKVTKKVPVTAKKKVVKKKTKEASKKTSKKTSATGRGRKPSEEILANMLAVLKHLAKLPKQSDGMTRNQLREALGVQKLGTPNLEAKGLVTCQKNLDGVRGNCYTITAEGREVAKKGQL